MHALAASHALHWSVGRSAADRDGLDFSLLAHQFGEDGTRAATEAILDDDDVLGCEGLCGHVLELVVTCYADARDVAAFVVGEL